MFFEDLPLCLEVGLSHLRDIADFYVSVFEIGKEEQARRSLHVLALQSLANFELLLCLNYFHLVEQFCDFGLAAIDAIEELILFFEDGEQSFTDGGKFTDSRY